MTVYDLTSNPQQTEQVEFEFRFVVDWLSQALLRIKFYLISDKC